MHSFPLLQLGKSYHIYLSAQHTGVLFSAETQTSPDQQPHYQQFLNLYSLYIEPIALTYAYCLLPNHFHLFIKIKSLKEQIESWYFADDEQLNEFEPLDPQLQFEQFLTAFARSMGVDTLFEQPLTVVLINSADSHPHLIRYIHQNPILHGHARHLRDWRWSSFAALTDPDASTRLQRETVIGWFYSAEWFEELHWEPVDVLKIGYLILED